MATEWKKVEKKKHTVPEYGNQHIVKAVNVKKTIPVSGVSKSRNGVNKQYQSSNANIIERKLDEGSLEIPMVSYSLQLQIQQARQNKKMSQKQLAIACNITENQLKGYENGSVMPNQQDLNKMGKVLEVVLRK